jgi:uncharacterized protein YdeI (YjbR/CyaY-like superfamily)
MGRRAHRLIPLDEVASVATNYEQVHLLTRAEWRDWLAEHHATAPGVWLVSYKAATGKPRFSYEAAVEEALCFGWIDSIERRLDDERSMLTFTPRKKRSNWSASNKARVERLIADGLMTPAGLAAVEVAKTDGSWTALDAVEALEMPADLRDALAANQVAHLHFDAFPPSVRKGIYAWIAGAKRPGTRQKRIAETVRLAGENIRANQPRP